MEPDARDSRVELRDKHGVGMNDELRAPDRRTLLGRYPAPVVEGRDAEVVEVLVGRFVRHDRIASRDRKLRQRQRSESAGCGTERRRHQTFERLVHPPVQLDLVVERAEQRRDPTLTVERRHVDQPQASDICDVHVRGRRTLGSARHLVAHLGREHREEKKPWDDLRRIGTKENRSLTEADPRVRRNPTNLPDGSLPCEDEIAAPWLDSTRPGLVGLLGHALRGPQIEPAS